MVFSTQVAGTPLITEGYAGRSARDARSDFSDADLLSYFTALTLGLASRARSACGPMPDIELDLSHEFPVPNLVEEGDR